MQNTQVKRRKLQPIVINKRVLDEQRAIARMLTRSPKEMMSASNAFLCGWLARDSMERSAS